MTHRYNTRFQAKQLQAKQLQAKQLQAKQLQAKQLQATHKKTPVYRTVYQTRSRTDNSIRDTIQYLQDRCTTTNCVERLRAMINMVDYLQGCTSFFKRNKRLHDALNCFIERFLEEEIPTSLEFHWHVNGHPECENKLFELEEMIETLQFMLNK